MRSGQNASLIRRLKFADESRYFLDIARNALGAHRQLPSRQWLYYTLNLSFDLVESLRISRPVDCPGRAHHAALSTSIQLDQSPRYRAYWYDAAQHALVGVLLGLDLHRWNDRYYLLESNLTAGLMHERRALYEDPIDPFIMELIKFARDHDFGQIVLHRRSWAKQYLAEFAHASLATGIRIIAASAMKHQGDPYVNPMPALPQVLTRNTMYVVCTATSNSPIFDFLHNKKFVANWFNDELQETGLSDRALRAIPTYDSPRIPEFSADPRWPNLVIKLANSDEGKDVLMGRFTSSEQARKLLGLSRANGLPRPFENSFFRYLVNRLFPGTFSPIYQPFVPPQVVEGCPMMIRMEVFISPMGDIYLSSHGTVGAEALPTSTPPDILLGRTLYNVSVPPGRFIRLDQDSEDELKCIAREFGDLAGRAIRKKFKIGSPART
jgi:hypothetical protein